MRRSLNEVHGVSQMRRGRALKPEDLDGCRTDERHQHRTNGGRNRTNCPRLPPECQQHAGKEQQDFVAQHGAGA